MGLLPKTFLLLLFLFLGPLVYAAPVADAVNERIPVNPADLEAHWGVDCHGLWARLEAQVGRSAASEPCGISPATRHELELCSFIYQPPGTVAAGDCPDYRGLLGRLDTTGAVDQCAVVATFLEDQGDCLKDGQRR